MDTIPKKWHVAENGMSLPVAQRRVNCLAMAAFAMSFASLVHGATPLDIEVAMEPGVAITAPQQWAQLLGKLDLGRVRLRGVQPNDQPKVTATESRIEVLAILSRRNELVLPKRRFKVSDVAALRKYFAELPARAAEGDAPRGRFDLTEEQFRSLYGDLSQMVDFNTTGMSVAEMLRRIEDQLATPMEIDGVTQSLLNDSAISRELRGVSAGAAMAIALREEGFALEPAKPATEPLRLNVIRYDRDTDTWPVGWKSEASPRQVAPKMFESLNIEISGYTLTQALDALKPRLGVPIILDAWILEREDIQLDQVQVMHPKEKTYLKKAVDRILSQARLAGDLRVDELGQPFYWVTQFGKDSVRAE